MKFNDFFTPRRALKTGLNPHEAAAGRQLIGGQVSRIRQHFQDLHKNRDPAAPGAPDMKDFDQVLDHWGITKAQLPQVIKVLKLEMWLYAFFAIPGFWLFYLFLQNFNFFFLTSSVLLIVMSATVFVCRWWRVKVLQEQQFIFFKDWFLGRESEL